MSKKQKAIIVDIDGTIAQKHPDRDIYDYSKIHMDLPIEPVLSVINCVLEANASRYYKCKLLFVSGREDSCKIQTEIWVETHLDGYDYSLFMRKTGDYRSDTVVKREIYEEHIKDKYNVIAVFDDRPCVLRMWRELGLFTFNVQQGENDF